MSSASQTSASGRLTSAIAYGTILGTAAWIVVAAGLAARHLDGFSQLPVPAVSLAFGTIALVITWHRPRVSAARELLAGGVLFLACVAAMRDAGRAVRLGLTFFVPAFVEEYVFRSALADRLKHLFLRARYSPLTAALAGAITAQVTFALCHLHAFTGRTALGIASEMLRLSTAGLIYYVLVLQQGLWLAAGMHGFLNAVLATAPESFAPEVRMSVTVLGAVVAVGLVRLELRSRNSVQRSDSVLLPHHANSSRTLQ